MIKSIKFVIKKSPKTTVSAAVAISTISFYSYFKICKSDFMKSKLNFSTTIKKLPLRLISRNTGKICDQTIPKIFRKPFFTLYSLIFNINLNELTQPLDSFETFNDFFIRKIDTEISRPIMDADLISPVDGRVISYGKINCDQIVEAKGIKYSLNELLGNEKLQNKQLYQISFYLSPGDYHRFHSPSNWSISSLRQFPGNLLPVSPRFSRFFPDMFCVNERIVLEGEWRHGYFSYVPIGALNVGSIKFANTIHSNVQTNCENEVKYEMNFKSENCVKVLKGQEIGYFKMGSSVVVVFEIPNNKNLLFRVRKNELVKIGEEIGVVY